MDFSRVTGQQRPDESGSGPLAFILSRMIDRQCQDTVGEYQLDVLSRVARPVGIDLNPTFLSQQRSEWNMLEVLARDIHRKLSIVAASEGRPGFPKIIESAR